MDCLRSTAASAATWKLAVVVDVVMFSSLAGHAQVLGGFVILNDNFKSGCVTDMSLEVLK